jgi:hypothetical protein
MAEPGWEEALAGRDGPAGRRPLTRAERVLVVGSVVDIACLLAFVPMAYAAGLAAVWLVLLPFYTLLPLLLLLAWVLVRGRGRVPPVVWVAVATLALVCVVVVLVIAAG